MGWWGDTICGRQLSGPDPYCVLSCACYVFVMHFLWFHYILVKCYAFVSACHVHAMYSLYTCQVLVVYLACTCYVLVMYLACTCYALVMYLACTCYVLAVYLACTC